MRIVFIFFNSDLGESTNQFCIIFPLIMRYHLSWSVILEIGHYSKVTVCKEKNNKNIKALFFEEVE